MQQIQAHVHYQYTNNAMNKVKLDIKTYIVSIISYYEV